MGLAIAVLVVAMLGGLGYLALLAGRSKQLFTEQNEVVPGRPSSAPASWAGSHEAEARLHRRLGEAMRALRTNQAFDDDGGLLELRVELEQQTIALDDRLVSIAALPERLRDEQRTTATFQVEQIEEAVAALVGRTAEEARPALAAALEQIRERTDLIARARAELEGLGTEPDQAGTTAGPVPGPPLDPDVEFQAQAPPPVTEPATVEPVETEPGSGGQTSPPTPGPGGQTSPPTPGSGGQTSPPTPS